MKEKISLWFEKICCRLGFHRLAWIDGETGIVHCYCDEAAQKVSLEDYVDRVTSSKVDKKLNKFQKQFKQFKTEIKKELEESNYHIKGERLKVK